MMKLLLAAGASLALAFAASPAAAQDAADDMEAVFAELADGFEVEPLTPEQEARMPIAREIMAVALPEGAMAELMDGFFGGGLLLEEFAQPNPNSALNGAFGHYFYLDLEPEQAEEALAIVDPEWRAREEAERGQIQEFTTRLLTAMEPVMRETMAELYAIYFTDAQLADIKAFYETPTGQVFAREGITMSSDPRLIAGMFRDDTFVQAIMGMPEELLEESYSAPAVRAFEDLSAEERRRLAVLTGQSLEDIEYALSWDYAEGEVMEEAMEEAADAMEEAAE